MPFAKTLRVFLLATIVVPAEAQTQTGPIVSFTGPYQSTVVSSSAIQLINDGVFQRETNPYIWTVFSLLVLNTDYVPNNGDTWSTGVDRRNADGLVQKGARSLLAYDAAQDCFVFVGIRLSFCNIRARAEVTAFRYNFFFPSDRQCIFPVDSQFRPFDYLAAGELIPAGGAATSLGEFLFRPTPFPIRPPLVSLSTNSVLPILPNEAIPGQAPAVDVDVFDDIQRPSGGNCNTRVPLVEVKIENTIAPGTGGHQHFANPAELGTGDYTLNSGLPLDPPANASIKAKTDLNGIVASYTPGELGLTEQIKVTARDPLRAIDLESFAAVDIRIPGLIQIIPENISAIHVDGGGCPHDPPAQWVTIYSHANLGDVTLEYTRLTGRQISLNDASLPFGGLMDNKSGGGRTSACHVSHRIGRDIDINSRDSAGVFIRCNVDPATGQPTNSNCTAGTYTNPGGRAEPLMKTVEDLFLEQAARQVPEGQSIHFRFSN